MLPWLFASLRGYRIGWLPRDLVAGLMLAAIAIPGQLATARLAGMPPETGLYAFAAGLIGFVALGEARTTRQGRGVAIGAAVLIFALVRILGIAANSFVVSRPGAEIFVWAIPLVTSLLCVDAIFHGPLFRARALIGQVSKARAPSLAQSPRQG